MLELAERAGVSSALVIPQTIVDGLVVGRSALISTASPAGKPTVLQDEVGVHVMVGRDRRHGGTS
jgi:hypothetical protein